MPHRKIEDYPSNALTELERRELRKMLDDHRRARWLWGTLQRTVLAIGAVAAALTAVKVLIGDLWK